MMRWLNWRGKMTKTIEEMKADVEKAYKNMKAARAAAADAAADAWFAYAWAAADAAWFAWVDAKAELAKLEGKE